MNISWILFSTSQLFIVTLFCSVGVHGIWCAIMGWHVWLGHEDRALTHSSNRDSKYHFALSVMWQQEYLLKVGNESPTDLLFFVCVCVCLLDLEPNSLNKEKHLFCCCCYGNCIVYGYLVQQHGQNMASNLGSTEVNASVFVFFFLRCQPF
jgi:hypothetical protein